MFWLSNKEYSNKWRATAVETSIVVRISRILMGMVGR